MVAAAEHLVSRGAKLTLASVVCLGRWDDARSLAATASKVEKQFALVLAALNGNVQAVKWMVGAGVDVNRPSADLYAHGTVVRECSSARQTQNQPRGRQPAVADLNYAKGNDELSEHRL